MSIKIRPADQDERDKLVISSWVETFGKLRPRGLAEWVWYEMHRGWIANTLKHAAVDVAELDSVPGEALGWICYEVDRAPHKAAIHYVCVKSKYAHHGIAKLLLAHAQGLCGEQHQITHLNAAGRGLIASKHES